MPRKAAMISLSQPDNRLYVGVGGSGKTTLALAHTWRFDRVIVCDPNEEKQHTEGADVVTDRGALVELCREKKFRVCWRFSDDEADKENHAYDWATKVALAAGDCCLLWDEAEFYVPSGPAMAPRARAAWNKGRHRRLHVFACTRSPFAISRHLTRNLTRGCIFAIQEESDQRWLKNFIGRDAAAAVPTLPKYHAVDWHQGGRWSVKKSLFD